MGEAKLRRPEFGLIGLGRFGSLVAAHLRAHGETVAFDRRPIQERAKSLGIRAGSIAEAAAARHVILCPPVAELTTVLRMLRPHLHPRTTLFDTCSVKVEPAQILREETPAETALIATHPLFGPDSAERGLAGLKIVLCPLRGGHPRSVARFLTRLGLEVIVTDPDQHDRQIAETQAVVQWIGRALERLGAGPRSIDTTGHRRLLEILHYVSRDSWQLFRDIETRNPYAAQARRQFLEALQAVEKSTMDGWEIVFRAAGITEAEVVKGYLESVDIPVDLDYESAGKIYGLTMDGLGEVRIRVPEEYADAARAAIDERLGREGAPPADDEPDVA